MPTRTYECPKCQGVITGMPPPKVERCPTCKRSMNDNYGFPNFGFPDFGQCLGFICLSCKTTYSGYMPRYDTEECPVGVIKERHSGPAPYEENFIWDEKSKKWNIISEK